jgi:hypothetical protein
MAIKYVVDVTDESDSSVVIDESYNDNTIYLYTGSQTRTKGDDLPMDLVIAISERSTG